MVDGGGDEHVELGTDVVGTRSDLRWRDIRPPNEEKIPEICRLLYSL